MSDPTGGPVRKKTLSKPARALRLLLGLFDPRAWAHAVKIVNYYNYSHVQPLRQVTLGPGAAISPNAASPTASGSAPGAGCGWARAACSGPGPRAGGS